MSIREESGRALRTPALILNGQETVAAAGTAEALKTTKTEVLAVIIKALPGNTDDVYIGDSDVSSANGLVLSPGDPVAIPIDDLAKVFVDVDVNGEGVSWVAFA